MLYSFFHLTCNPPLGAWAHQKETASSPYRETKPVNMKEFSTHTRTHTMKADLACGQKEVESGKVRIYLLPFEFPSLATKNKWGWGTWASQHKKHHPSAFNWKNKVLSGWDSPNSCCVTALGCDFSLKLQRIQEKLSCWLLLQSFIDAGTNMICTDPNHQATNFHCLIQRKTDQNLYYMTYLN